MTFSRDTVIRLIEEDKIIAIVRGYYDERADRLAESLLCGGVRLMEFTFDQKDPFSIIRAAACIERLSSRFEGQMCFGAGTVMTVEQADLAAGAGARFIISPDTCEEGIRRTLKHSLVSIPGALTPTEIAAADRFGADFVKIFPADFVGPAYFKAVRAPISHVKLLAVGGVGLDNLSAFLQAGASGAGVGSALFTKELIAEGAWDTIAENARKLMEAQG